MLLLSLIDVYLNKHAAGYFNPLSRNPFSIICAKECCDAANVISLTWTTKRSYTTDELL